MEKRQVLICPSAVRRMREHAPQKGSLTGAMMPISPGAPSAKRQREEVSEPRRTSAGTSGKRSLMRR